MKTAIESPWRHLFMWVRFYYAIHFLESGLNFALFHFIPDFSRAGAAGPMQVELANIGLYQLVKYAEVVTGALLLVEVLAPLVLILMAAISFFIIYLNLFISPDPRQLFSGTQEVLLVGTLLVAYGGYYADMCRVRSGPFWFWDGFSGRGRPVPLRPAGAVPPMQVPAMRDYVLLAIVALVATAMVMRWSTNAGQRPLRLYDYGPPLGAALLTMIVMAVRTRRRGAAGA
jgi:putative oxidoreductase